MKEDLKELLKLSPLVLFIVLCFVYGFVLKFLQENMSKTAFLIVTSSLLVLSAIIANKRLKKKGSLLTNKTMAILSLLLLCFVYGLPALLGVFIDQ